MKQMEINLRVKQQRYVMTIYKRIRVLLPKNHPSIMFRERRRNFQLNIGTNNLMNSGK